MVKQLEDIIDQRYSDDSDIRQESYAHSTQRSGLKDEMVDSSDPLQSFISHVLFPEILLSPN